MSFDHLLGVAKDAVLWTPEDRIDFINEDRWIGYSAAATILTEFDDLVEHPRNLRMPCRYVVGDPDNGKTMLLHQCIKRHPFREKEGDESHVAVLVFETPPVPDEGRLYSQILKALRVAHREDAPPEKLLAKVIERFSELGIRLLMADEFHNMLNGSASHQRQFLASLKSLINTLRVSFVAAGTEDITRALATDSQFITRFEKLALPTWGINKETRSLLSSIEKTLPLAEPSGLADDRDLALGIILGGKGKIGGIVKVAKKAAIAAIRGGKEKIAKDIVDKVVAELREREFAA
ncbi:TniB family NTP-binding protein [Sulfuritalea hydrogenivorans]|uniref:Urease subunit alpha n=1 Tax=Sulfuritalea hydrogenivorans sk43H TaxID=1223802 RepID=W0SEY0_9PROT|nr:TniB family NTP-binding protein [Sulfuritalea hydrogenivorans]BAO28288.1 urease subunit alpha [Sulfuritalea hydrogenivorans sk43H]